MDDGGAGINDLTHVDRRVEGYALSAGGHHPLPRIAPAGDPGGLVHDAHDHPAENVAVAVGVLGKQCLDQFGLAVIHHHPPRPHKLASRSFGASIAGLSAMIR